MTTARIIAVICFLLAGVGVLGVCVPAHCQYGTPTVTVPTYGAGLGAGQPSGDADLRKEIAALRQDIAELRKVLKELMDDTAEAKAGAAPAAATDHLQAGANVCASCHTPDVAAEKGGDFKLFDDKGAFRQFTDRDLDKIVNEISKGRMPPPKKAKITPEQKEALLQAFKPTK